MGILSVEGRGEEEGLFLGEGAGEVGMVSISVKSVRIGFMYRRRRLVKRR